MLIDQHLAAQSKILTLYGRKVGWKRILFQALQRWRPTREPHRRRRRRRLMHDACTGRAASLRLRSAGVPPAHRPPTPPARAASSPSSIPHHPFPLPSPSATTASTPGAPPAVSPWGDDQEAPGALPRQDRIDQPRNSCTHHSRNGTIFRYRLPPIERLPRRRLIVHVDMHENRRLIVSVVRDVASCFHTNL
jgi:hypothetical protein